MIKMFFLIIFFYNKSSIIYNFFVHRLLVVKENLLKVPLRNINFNPSNSNEFCVAGQSYCVMVYDQRNVSKPLYKLWPNYVVRLVLSLLLKKFTMKAIE